jgi:arsenate reductase
MVDPVQAPSVLFVCVHNAGRSQMAAAWLTHLSRGSVRVHSAGTDPGAEVEPAAVAAMAEAGVDISAELPKALDAAAVLAADVCVTMGCGDACPVFPGKRYLDWTLQDPAGQGMETVRRIRDEIKALVEALIRELAEDPRPAAG